MNIFHNRPLFLSCMAFLLFSVIGYFTPSGYKILLISVLLLLAAFFVLLYFILKRISKYVLLCVILSSVLSVTALASSYAYFEVDAKGVEKYHNEYHDIEAIVIDSSYPDNTISVFEIVVTQIDGESTYHKATLSCKYTMPLSKGYKIKVKGALGTGFDSSSGSYNEKLALYSDKIFIEYVSDDEFSIDIVDTKVFHPRLYFETLNKEISDIFSYWLDGQTASICSAIFLGNRDALADTVKRDFTRAGASHILALSGMHMSIIMGFFMLLLKKLGVSRKKIGIILSVCAVFYLCITGFKISAARSVIMLLCVYASWLFDTVSDSLTSLSIAAVVLMLIFPGSVIDGAFWMSFAATLGILVFMNPFTDYMKRLVAQYNWHPAIKKWSVKLISLIAVSVFATIPLIIVLCVFIKQYSFYSIVSSVVLALPTAGIIIMSLLLVIFSKVGFIATVISAILIRLADVMVSFCGWISNRENTIVSLNYPFILIIALLIGIALIYSLAVKRRNIFVSLIPFVSVVVLFVAMVSLYNGTGKGKIDVTYVNVNASSDMLVLTDNVGNAVICDVGNGSNTSYYEALDIMYDARAVEVKAIVLTRYLNYHNSSLQMMFTKEKVRELWLPYPQNEKDLGIMKMLASKAERYGVKVFIYEEGEALSLFENTNMRINSYNIDRSVKPVSTICIITGKEVLTYCSSAYNECDEIAEIERRLRNSNFIIFGDSGPKIKTSYSVPKNDRTEYIVFSNAARAEYYENSGMEDIQYRIVSDSCRIRLSE